MNVQDLHIHLSRLGFRVTVDEIRRFKHSVMQSITSTVSDISGEAAAVSTPIVHYVADNVDHNLRTVDGPLSNKQTNKLRTVAGLNTFHDMGIISTILCPEGKFGKTTSLGLIPRLSKPMKASEATRNRSAPIVTFTKESEPGISLFRFGDIESLRTSVDVSSVLKLNKLWSFTDVSCTRRHLRPNWSGFMQSVFHGPHSGVSHVEFLSIIDLNPSDMDCVYSTLIYISQQAQQCNVSAPDITFDQPLYFKAVDIVAKCKLDIVVRLGGFHMLMSFLGSIGHVMRGRGLEDVLGVIFGSNTVEHILNGKAYARTIKGHLLICKALQELLLTYLQCDAAVVDVEDDYVPPVVLCGDEAVELRGAFTSVLCERIENVYTAVCEQGFTEDNAHAVDVEGDAIATVFSFLDKLKLSLSAQSRTAKLWMFYITCVELLKQFLVAERTGNWNLHLHVVFKMLSIFAATGHVNYAKSARIYLQQMKELPATHSHLYKLFLDGNHTVRRSDRYWAGLSMDLIIEQTMMRAVKSRGGLTRGRGLHESVRTTWLSTLTDCATVRSALSKFVGMQKHAAEHVDTGPSRMRRDCQDLSKLLRSLQTYSPFRFLDPCRLIALSSGTVAGIEDGVNCDEADAVGSVIQAPVGTTCPSVK